MKKALWLTGVIIPVFSSIDQLSVNLLPCTVVWAFAANAAKTNADKIIDSLVQMFFELTATNNPELEGRLFFNRISRNQ